MDVKISKTLMEMLKVKCYSAIVLSLKKSLLLWYL